MAYLVTHLERHGYVKIITDPADGRARRVQLTRRGNQFIETLLKASADMEIAVGKKMGATKVRQLREALKALDLAIAGLD
jgi:DNA-binding MarR family transcriptional regulator